ncbi:MAG: ABC transporter substrate-binding protein [Alphaproteobacteria bacterium]
MTGVVALVLAGVLAGAAMFAGTPDAAGKTIMAHPLETPSLRARVAKGELPPVIARLPAEPAVVAPSEPGRHGGELRLLMSRSKDIRYMVVNGYARLVGYNPKYELVPDLLRAVEIEDGRVFTFHLRKGHRWSDGHPFTAEDFRYYWEDVAGQKMLSPTGPPIALRVAGKPPRFEIVDEVTVRYSWDQPNPFFLPALAGARPLFIYRPAHYLKRFHMRHAAPAALAKLVKDSGQRNWAALHNRKDNQYKNDNPELPSLQPWTVRTRPPSERFVFERNPFYHRVDLNGRQLPYIDRVVMNIAGSRVIPIKTGAGETDLQARGINFSDYTFLRESGKRNGFTTELWDTAKGARIALYPNLNHADPVWKKLLRDVRFRRALSLAINRHEINQVVYFGLALEGNNTLLPYSPLHAPRLQTLWAVFDLDRANQLLDSIGLTARDSQGIRLLPDGRPLEIIVETAGESTEQTDVLELIHDGWRAAGIKLFTKPSQREVLRNRVFAGSTIMSVWSGLENGLATADHSPAELAPTSQQQLHWPKWGQYFETRGQAGEAPDMPAAKRLLALNQTWREARDGAERRAIWKEMLDIQAENVFTIGLVAAVPQPVVIDDDLRNVPKKAVYNWDPGAQFGIYRPDSFWFAPGRRGRAR